MWNEAIGFLFEKMNFNEHLHALNRLSCAILNRNNQILPLRLSCTNYLLCFYSPIAFKFWIISSQTVVWIAHITRAYYKLIHKSCYFYQHHKVSISSKKEMKSQVLKRIFSTSSKKSSSDSSKYRQ